MMGVERYAVCEDCRAYIPLEKCDPVAGFILWEEVRVDFGDWFDNGDRPNFEMIYGALNLQAFVMKHGGHRIYLCGENRFYDDFRLFENEHPLPWERISQE